ncbi:MAG: hypothetical protein AB2A00_24000 [Myxococcota bacterium]
MPKVKDDIKDWQRCLVRLEKLDARLVHCASGPHLVRVKAVRHVTPLLHACQAHAPPTLQQLQAGVDVDGQPLALTPAFLAGCQHDLKRLGKALQHRDLRREAPRLYRRYGGLTPAWLDEKQERITALSRELVATDQTWPDPDPSLPRWFSTTLVLIAELHGKPSAQTVSHLANQWARQSRELRVPGTDPHVVANTLARLGLLFPAGATHLALEDVQSVVGPVAERVRMLGATGITLGQALTLLKLPISNGALRRCAEWVAEGLEPSLLQAAAAVHPLNSLRGFHGEANTVRAWCHWLSRLVPHYAAQGVTLALPIQRFAQLRVFRDVDLGLLLHCLMDAPTRDTGSAIRSLGTALALFRGAPDRAHQVLARLEGTTPGLGRRTDAAFASWLDDDPLLDRYLHLCALAQEPVALSRALLEDYSRAARVRGQLEHLRSVPEPTEEQKHRILQLLLQHDTDEAPTPARTRRRIADRIPDLLQRAWRVQHDELVRILLRELWNITLPEVTPAWRDALQFHFVVEQNQGLLARLLRLAAANPGRPIVRASAENQAWLASAQDHMDVAAWLAPRRRTVELNGRSLTLHLEEDPLEVLRMGIPFHTCLSLTDGENAASTIINALDANKRVLYVRDASGTILARKLLAITEEHQLLGYRLYVASRELAPQIAHQVEKMCRELAEACGVERTNHGRPRQLHAGFWYDDGAFPFAAKEQGSGAND